MPPGTYGSINTKQTPSGAWRARTILRGYDGIYYDIEKHGASAADAERRLKAEIADRQQASGSELIKPTTTFADLVAFWLGDLATRDDGPSGASIAKYRTTLTHLVTSMGGLRIREVTPGLVDSKIKELPSADMRRKCRSHLVNMFDLAMIHQAAQTNPVLATTRHKRKDQVVEDIPMETLEQIREAVQKWMNKKRSGPKHTDDLADIVELLLATGSRIGEILALRWEDCDLNTKRPTITITGSIRYEKGKGNFRDTPKTKASVRTFVLPSFAAQLLRRRRIAQPPNPLGAVFCTRNGTWHQLSNMQRRWRGLRAEAELDWVKFHSFRRTVATQIDAAVDADAAARQLGHASKQVTEKHYINRAPTIVDLSGVIEERFAPKRPATTNGPNERAE